MTARSASVSDSIDLSSPAAGAAITVAAAILQAIRPLTPAHAKDDSILWDSAGQRGRSVARLAREILEAMETPEAPETPAGGAAKPRAADLPDV